MRSNGKGAPGLGSKPLTTFAVDSKGHVLITSRMKRLVLREKKIVLLESGIPLLGGASEVMMFSLPSTILLTGSCQA